MNFLASNSGPMTLLAIGVWIGVYFQFKAFRETRKEKTRAETAARLGTLNRRIVQ